MKPDDSNETKIAIIGNNIEYIKKDIAAINSSLEKLSEDYLTKQEYTDNRKALLERVEQLEKSGNLWKWLSPILAAVLGSVVTLLTISYLSTLK